MSAKTLNPVKKLFRKLFNILTPTVLIVGVGLISAGMTVLYLNNLVNITDITTRLMYLTQIALLWTVFLTGVATHFTLWTDVEESLENIEALETAKGPQ